MNGKAGSQSRHMGSPLEALNAALADRYAIERELGSGGMATVYLAEDMNHHRKVAVKVLRRELAAALGSERFLQEIQVTARLSHPHILPRCKDPRSAMPRSTCPDAPGIPQSMATVIGEVSIMNRHAASSRVIKIRPGAAELAASSVICVLAVLACRGNTDSAAGWDGTVRDSAGVEIVENFGAPLWPEGPGWEFTQDLKIGAVDGPPEYQFGRIGGLQVLSDGRFAVTDIMAHELCIFSSDGRLERTVGREGQGPGEFGSGSLGLFRGPADTLLVSDPANNRMNIIAPNGTWLDSWSRLPTDGSAGSYWTGSVPTGRLVSVHHPLRKNDGTLTDTLDFALERDVHGAILDTLARLPSYLTFFRGGPETLMRYYNAWWEVRQWGDGLMIARTDQYRFSFYGPDGNLERIVSLAREPLAITDEDRSVMLASWDAFLQEAGVPADAWEDYKSRLLFSDTYPSYRLSFYGPAGTLLVQRVRLLRDLSAEERKEVRANLPYAPRSPEWEVFDTQGRYLGVVVIPGTGFPKPSGFFRFYQDRASGKWYMASVWEDELEVQYIVRWRIDGRMPV